jgi:mycoredoxin
VAELTVYSTSWCGYCVRLKRQLSQQGVTFAEVNIEEDAEAEAFVKSANGGNALVPTVLLPDGRVLSNPPVADVLAGLAAS